MRIRGNKLDSRKGGRKRALSYQELRRLPVVRETSAGGVVVREINGQPHVALLKTRHVRGEVWVLPKGHVEHAHGETFERAALREVKEELGIARVRIRRKLGTVRWQFIGTINARAGFVERPPGWRQADRLPPDAGPWNTPVRVLKTVHHFLMEGLSETLHPQAEEGFLEARWVPLREAVKLVAYPTDRSILLRVRAPRAAHSSS